MFDWLKKRRKPEPRYPVNEEAVRVAEEELRRSEAQLRTAESRSPEVDRAAQTLEEYGKIDYLGPQFLAALGKHRKRA